MRSGQSSRVIVLAITGVAASVLAASPALAGFMYSARELGSLGGYTTNALDLNDWGDVVGQSSVDGYSSHAFIYRNGQITDLNILSPRGMVSTMSWANAINNAGQIAGTREYYNLNMQWVSAGFRMEADGTLVEISDTHRDTYANAINEAGVVAGTCVTTDYDVYGFHFGKSIQEFSPGGYSNRTVEDINDHNQITGSDVLGGGDMNQAYRWENGTYTALGFAADPDEYPWYGGPASGGKAINNHGVVAGYSAYKHPDYSEGGFWPTIFEPGKAPKPLVGLGPGMAWDINDDGVVVGEADRAVAAGTSDWCAFVYKDGKMFDLNEVVIGLGSTELFVARGVNRYGQIIADGWDPTFGTRAFLISPLGFVHNADFARGTLDGWEIIIPPKTGAMADLIEYAPGQFAARLITGSPISIEQGIDTPDEAFGLYFDYQFTTTTGVLQVFLGEELLGTIDAPGELPTGFTTAYMPVASLGLWGQMQAPLRFTLDGPTGSSILLTNITAVPEPGAVAALGGSALLLLRRRRLSRAA